MVDLHKLRINEIKSYSLEETKEIIDSLEQVNTLKLNGIGAVEELETFYFITNLIIERINAGSFPELVEQDNHTNKEKNKIKQERNKLRGRLKVLSNRFVTSIEINNMTLQAVYRVDETAQMMSVYKAQLEEQLNRSNEKMNGIKLALDNYSGDVEKLKKDIEESEHNILTHVLTLLGVFSAIIVTIMSVVITSSSWLNSAGGDGAMIVFVVPTGIVVVAIIVMLTLIYPLYGPRDTEDNTKKKKTTVVFFVFAWGVVICIGALIAWLGYLQSKEWETVHVRYVLEESEYSILEKCNEGTYYEFNVDGVKYIQNYDADLLHDGTLHFCEKHKALE